ncbi:PH domain-containing protein [Nocardioides donggukensis]|uniref:PH domain-containing protein n=1 Tax=Nocardioides donggukensis TaxID=2774019 RepID=A0A927PZT2_9ACTN|nr:PH domain-containing protein [Nocardioides donggukensis]MBD8869715.1 PH domain-containing protein [Nocardioides donggukensis]
MPAASEVTLPHTWRPLGVRLAGTALGGMLLIVCAAAWIAFPPEVKETFSFFQRATLLFLGGLAFSAWFALVRSRLVATDAGLVVVNGYRRRDLEWAEVVAVHLPSGAPWAVLDLADGNTCPVMAIQGSDGARARRDLAQLRALLNRR